MQGYPLPGGCRCAPVGGQIEDAEGTQDGRTLGIWQQRVPLMHVTVGRRTAVNVPMPTMDSEGHVARTSTATRYFVLNASRARSEADGPSAV